MFCNFSDYNGNHLYKIVFRSVKANQPPISSSPDPPGRKFIDSLEHTPLGKNFGANPPGLTNVILTMFPEKWISFNHDKWRPVLRDIWMARQCVIIHRQTFTLNSDNCINRHHYRSVFRTI